MIRINAQKLKDDADYRDLVEYIRTAELFTEMEHVEDPAERQSWLQMKVASQRKALKALNDRVYNQRIQLRLLNQLGRGLTREEWDQAKTQYGRLDEDLLVK